MRNVPVKITRWIAESVGGLGPLEELSWPFDREIEARRQLDQAREIEREVTGLFDELRAPVLRYLLSMGLPASDAEEVVQEVFLALFQHLRRGRPRTNLRGWVFRTAHNLGLKARRRRHQGQRRLSDDAALEGTADPTPSPEQLLSLRQRQARMLAVTAALPRRDQSCLSLRAEGLSYREIAQALGMSLGSVSMSIQRSVARLREADR